MPHARTRMSHTYHYDPKYTVHLYINIQLKLLYISGQRGIWYHVDRHELVQE